jgi:hypothetical protein
MHLRYTKKSSETDKEDKEDLTEQPLSPPWQARQICASGVDRWTGWNHNHTPDKIFDEDDNKMRTPH